MNDYNISNYEKYLIKNKKDTKSDDLFQCIQEYSSIKNNSKVNFNNIKILDMELLEGDMFFNEVDLILSYQENQQLKYIHFEFKKIMYYDIGGNFNHCEKIDIERLKEGFRINFINKRKNIFNFFYQLLNTLFSLIIVALAMLEALSSKLLLGSLMTYINTTTKVESAINNIASSCFTLYTDSVYCEYILSFFRLVDNKKYQNNEEKIKIDSIKNIELKNVSYRYKNRKNYSLKNISLKLNSGEINALVGENGSGKTTLIKILTGLYTDYEGTVLVNDIDLRKIDMKDYQNKISTVFQDYNNYEFDAKNNIGVGDITQINNKEKIIKAAKLTGADDIIQTLPNKYDQQLGNWFSGGIQLSGGQWQKIAIARSLIRCASMYILDEPTAALDPSAEYSFFKNFRNNILDKIGIFVTHRFSNVKIADNIFVLKDGKLIEQGTHKSLMNNKGDYAKLYNIQIGE